MMRAPCRCTKNAKFRPFMPKLAIPVSDRIRPLLQTHIPLEVLMKMASILSVFATMGVLILFAMPASAHHSFAAEFDATKCREFTGTLTKLDWQSPHPYFFMDVKNTAGKIENWTFQTYAPITLRRNGTDRQ